MISSEHRLPLFRIMLSYRAMPCSGTEIVALERVEIAVVPWRWDFAHARADDIARHFAARQREDAGVHNGFAAAALQAADGA
jgi:hypothetical protein